MMVINIDRTTKFLLTVIALLLVALVCKPLFKVTPDAQAQTSTASTATSTVDTSQYVGSRSSLISSIAISSKDRVRNLLVLDSARSFIIQYDDRFEIYRVSDINKDQLGTFFKNKK